MNRLSLIAALWLLGAIPVAVAGEPVASAPASRYSLKQVRAESAQRSERYALKARFAPAESAGELREGENFVLIGRFAKAGSGCALAGSTIFRNGFEG